MRIERLNDLRYGERLLKTFKYFQRGTKSRDLLKYRYIKFDKFSRSCFFGLYRTKNTFFYDYWRLITSVRTRLSLSCSVVFYTGIVEDKLIDRCLVSLDKLSGMICESWPIRLCVARSITQVTQKNYFVLNNVTLYVKNYVAWAIRFVSYVAQISEKKFLEKNFLYLVLLFWSL